MRRPLLALILLLSPTPAAARPRAELVVFEAASLKDVLARLATAFEAAHPTARVALNAAGSQELRAQIEQGAVADLFVAADHRQMDRLVAAGLVAPPVLLACNRPVLVTRPGLDDLRSLADLPRAARVVLGASEVPIGAYAELVFRRAAALYGADFPARVQARVVSRELNVRQVLAKVTLGEADAAVVYASDAARAHGKVRMVELPPAVSVLAEYPVALVRGGAQPALARAFLDFIRGPAGAAALADAGFVPCPHR
jgi:molybdate transport system substrate-binding protein